MKIRIQDFCLKPGQKVRLGKWPTRVDPFYRSKKECRHKHKVQIRKLSSLQGRLHASDRYALLLIFQAMDAAGKDSVIKHVMSGVNPQGCQVHSFKQPSVAEREHDFLWRTTQALPERGQIGIFNRSYYEEVLIVRVHPEQLRTEGVAGRPVHRSFWHKRYQSIAAFEKHLHRSGTRVIKFFLHLSRDEQRRRFLARIESPKKSWKLTWDDLGERKRWAQYMKAYEECLEATSTRKAPWYIVPADDKPNARLIVSKVILKTLRSLKLDYPKIDAGRKRDLRAFKSELRK